MSVYSTLIFIPSLQQLSLFPILFHLFTLISSLPLPPFLFYVPSLSLHSFSLYSIPFSPLPSLPFSLSNSSLYPPPLSIPVISFHSFSLLLSLNLPHLLSPSVFFSSSFLPLLVSRLLIEFTTHKEEPSWKGYLYAVLMFTVPLIQSILEHQHFHEVFRIGMQMRTAIIAAVYKKVRIIQGFEC